MKISKIEIMAADVPFKGHQENVGEIALGKWKTCRFVIVKVHTDEGIVGHGESAPFARLSQLGQKPIADILVDYLAPAVIGKDPFDVEAIWKAMDRATPYASQAKGAIDMALYDIMGKKSVTLLPKTGKILEQMGEQIRLARMRRKISVALAAERAGVSRASVWAVEKGSAAVAIGIYAAVLHAISGMDTDLLKVAADDELGQKLHDIELLKKYHPEGK